MTDIGRLTANHNTSAELATTAGRYAQLIVNDDNKRVTVMDGILFGGYPHALLTDVTAHDSAAKTLTNTTIDATLNTIIKLALAMFASGVIDTDSTFAANSDSRLPTQKAVATALAAISATINGLIAAADAMVYKGNIDASTNPNYPAADRGHTYKISVAGKIGGASGQNVEVNDLLLCTTDGTVAGNQATVGANWNITQANIDGAVIGPASSVNGNLASFSGTGGKLVADSGKATPGGAIVGTTDLQTLIGKTINGVSNTITVRLGNDVTGNLPITNLNGGTSASGSTFWRGDGVWASPTGGGNVTGPVSSVNSNIALFSGTSGTLLSDGGYSIDNDGTLVANSASRFATQQAIKTYVDGRLDANDALVYKGFIDASTNPNYPAANAGHTYRISVAGKIGGASGQNVEIGDRLTCNVDSTAAGNQATVGANWDILQNNIDGAVIGPVSSTTDNVATYNGVTGKVIKDSGKAVPGGAIVGTTDTQILSGKSISGAGLPLNGSTSGSVTVKVPAIAGSNTLTLPAGTTDLSATGGASQFLKQVSAGAPITVAQVTQTDIGGTARTTWTPTDGSGGGLTFVAGTNYNDCILSKTGNRTTVQFDILFPTNSNGNNAAISGIPSSASATSGKAAGGQPSYTNYGSGISFLVNAAGGTIEFYTLAGVPLTNANLSGKAIRGCFPLITA